MTPERNNGVGIHSPGEGITLSKIQSLNRLILLSFVAVALALVFWSVIRAPVILAREDNPRLVEAELAIQRGRIVDRNGTVLAQTIVSAEEDEPTSQFTRVYPVSNIGPAVGYYSFRHGTAGVEEGYNAVLRGDTGDVWADFLRQSLHQPQIGRDIRLTLDAQWQQTADSLLPDQPGALILLSLPDAEIRALSSHPGYDPNRLDEQFETLIADESAPLLNRVTQGQYQPGLVLQPLLLAAAVDRRLIELDGPVEDPNRPAVINGLVTRCTQKPASPATWADVLRYRCPGPLMDLAQQLGDNGLNQVFADFGLNSNPVFALNTETPESESVDDPSLAGIGQGNLTITPLQVSLAWAALGMDGRLPSPELVTAVTENDGEWQPAAGEADDTPSPFVAETAARQLRQALPQHDNIREHSVRVLSGPEGSTNSWYLGLAPAHSPRYAVVVVVEGSRDLSPAQEAGRALLQYVLSQSP